MTMRRFLHNWATNAAVDQVVVWAIVVLAAYALARMLTRKRNRHALKRLFFGLWVSASLLTVLWRITGIGRFWGQLLLPDKTGNPALFHETLLLLGWVLYLAPIAALTRLIFDPAWNFRSNTYHREERQFLRFALPSLAAFTCVVAFFDLMRQWGYASLTLHEIFNLTGITSIVLVTGALGYEALLKAPAQFWTFLGYCCLVLAGAAGLIWFVYEISQIPGWIWALIIFFALLAGGAWLLAKDGHNNEMLELFAAKFISAGAQTLIYLLAVGLLLLMFLSFLVKEMQKAGLNELFPKP